MATPHYVPKARKPVIRDGQVIVEKGQPYWWYQFYKLGTDKIKPPKTIFLTKPRNSQIQTSPFLKQIELWREEIEDFSYQPHLVQSFILDLIFRISVWKCKILSNKERILDKAKAKSRIYARMGKNVSKMERVMLELQAIRFDIPDEEPYQTFWVNRVKEQLEYIREHYLLLENFK